MSNDELDKTFVERSLNVPVPAAYGGVSAPQSSVRPVIGQTRLGSCVVTEIIGEGGMANVYKVWNERLEVYRAVKMLSQEASSARFETEAKITAKLHHKGIVEIHNIGEWNGLPYMEMEFVDGSDLQRILAERGRLPEIVCIAIAAVVAQALSHAHTKTFTLVGKQYCGIIHRDLKPANIMVSRQGAVKLTDFGIARPTQASLHTVDGNIAGTMHYLSPEQMDGGVVDNRSDIYSFGAILYEIITGVKTFPQESITELMKQKSVNKFKPLSEYGIQINAGFAKIILRCLKHDPAKRYQSTLDLAGDLQKLNDSMTNQTPESVLENYFNGTINTVYAGSGKTKTRWFKSKTKILSTPDKLKTAGLTVEQELLETQDFPKAAEQSETPKTAVTSYKLKTAELPAGQRPSWKPKPAWKSIISTNPQRMIFIVPLLLLTLFSLSYITIRIVTAKSSSAKSSQAKTFISADAALDPAAAAVTEPVPGDTTASTQNTELNTGTTPPNVSSVAMTAAPPPARSAAAPSTPAAVRPSKPAAATPEPKSENEHLRDAIAASNARQWDRAVEILVQDGVYRTRNNHRTLYLFNAYVESWQFDKAKAIMDTASLVITQDAYFLLSTGKYWHYRGNSSKAIEYFESSLYNTSIAGTENLLPFAALFFIADIKHQRFKAAPSASNKSAALEAWNEVRKAFASRPNDSRAKRAEREISALKDTD